MNPRETVRRAASMALDAWLLGEATRRQDAEAIGSAAGRLLRDAYELEAAGAAPTDLRLLMGAASGCTFRRRGVQP